MSDVTDTLAASQAVAVSTVATAPDADSGAVVFEFPQRVEFFVYGVPVQQGGKRINRATGSMYDQAKSLGPWRQEVAGVAEKMMNGRLPTTMPCLVSLAFYFRRPTSHYRVGAHAGELKPSAPQHHAQTPDIDKLERAILDSLTMGGVYSDDKLVHQVLKVRNWTDRFHGKPGVQIIVVPEEHR